MGGAFLLDAALEGGAVGLGIEGAVALPVPAADLQLPGLQGPAQDLRQQFGQTPGRDRASEGNGGAGRLVVGAAPQGREQLAQRQIPDKTNEIPEFQPLLTPLDLEGKVVTADAMHAQVEHARFVVEQKRADYVFTVKGNQPTLLQDIRDLDDGLFPPPVTQRNKGHGRIEVRTIQARSELQDHLEFPHAHQVFRIHRQVTHLKSGKVTEETAYGVTSPTREQASPERLLSLVREHWHIENKLHYIRDVTYDGDRS